MTPPCHSFPAAQLPLKIQTNLHGRRRKHEAPCSPTHKIDLSACELLRMVQYKCHVQRPLSREGTVQCFPVERLFRRCKDKNGPFMVETTAWEATNAAGKARRHEDARARPLEWSTSWADGDAAR
ncbi:hypothetical protein E4U43_004531 [Claviceps pusilla]|uniref:Uncharacterized protein n=1 Tax=Claviceps pusilla TaxID=123648 RepID=A0A9P7N5S3_9HYPO|nr:hypothetical protein E4U43_004531 [Claviceps pusilla]